LEIENVMHQFAWPFPKIVLRQLKSIAKKLDFSAKAYAEQYHSNIRSRAGKSFQMSYLLMVIISQTTIPPTKYFILTSNDVFEKSKDTNQKLCQREFGLSLFLRIWCIQFI